MSDDEKKPKVTYLELSETLEAHINAIVRAEHSHLEVLANIFMHKLGVKDPSEVLLVHKIDDGGLKHSFWFEKNSSDDSIPKARDLVRMFEMLNERFDKLQVPRCAPNGQYYTPVGRLQLFLQMFQH